ncbi:hypothetical protein CAPTEDRAFT_175882 [Capitella teleta]|uniref:Bystin n=1 Tax=Capitella teleta TaxID=283909 RepID=R7U6A6_CAPTE|nr:hypothetical protein CAPTEDRAFT_175882 [Capitella teleta]|eukprot:ELT99216.1 hypothetical protein CAPTEDRAFT_175882 [Capitella teleta]
MGKIKIAKRGATGGDSVQRPTALAEQIIGDKTVKGSTRTKDRKRNDDDDEFVGDKLSRKILTQARLQQEELQQEVGIGKHKKKIKKAVSLGAGPSETQHDSDSETEFKPEDYEAIEVDEEDERALAMFMSAQAPTQRTLADIIQEKITEKQTEIRSEIDDNASLEVKDLDDRVVAMYRGVRDILTKYRSGPLPKALKIVPHLANWEQVLYLTEPEQWSAAAMYQVTRIFASNLNAKMAQRFFNLVLYPRIRDDIAEYKRLNFHLYMAVRKSLFKPAAFFKGILLPLCESGTCTLREAIIVASILGKNSVPMLHSAAALLKIAEMSYTGANSIFLRTLLDKKYALPYRVIDAVVFHFLGFRSEQRELPVLWHQSLLTFVQRYKEDISSEQKEGLMDLLRIQQHPGITPEIRRELIRSKCRDAETAPSQAMED